VSVGPGRLATAAAPWREDARIVAVVSFAHLVSHFFQLILAPLFPWIRAEFALSNVELGLLMSVVFTVSGGGQALAGFVVDRYGPLRTLNGGLACLTAAAVTFAAADSYAMLLVGAVLAGLGNAVFHPVDFWLINHRVSVPRLGPAFSAHGLSGSLGWALAPPFLVGLAMLYGWRSAVAAAALLPLLTIALVMHQRPRLAAPFVAPRSAGGGLPAPSLLGFLAVPAIWWCFAFFVCVAAALGGVQSFAPTVLTTAYDLGRASAALSITGYMLGSALGMLLGGWLVARSRRLEANIAVGLACAVAAALVIGARLVPGTYALALMVVMGLGTGLSGPSRDMLIRHAAPPGATGRVYGVVYSGLDVGIALGPLLFGRMLDHGLAAEVFYAVAGCLVLGMLTAWRVAAASQASGAAAGSLTQRVE